MAEHEAKWVVDEARRVATELDGLLAAAATAGPERDAVMAKFERNLAGATKMMHASVDVYFREKRHGYLTGHGLSTGIGRVMRRALEWKAEGRRELSAQVSPRRRELVG